MDLEFDKYCKVDQSPTTVLPSPRYAKSRRGRQGLQNDKLSLEAGFREIKFRNYHRSVSCRTLPVRSNELSVDSDVLKRGSVCQTSKERKPFKGLETVEERTKIEVSLSGDSPFSFSLLDSICGSDDESISVKSAERDSMENPEFKCHQVIPPSCNANTLKESDNRALRNSMSDISSPRSRFTSIRKMFDPLTKSKSHRSPLVRSSDPITVKDSDVSVPDHFHGDLRLEHKHGVPYFELSLAHSEDIFMAKTWKSEDSLNWVYTFHSMQGRKKSNVPIVGQMQVSCHLLSDVKDSGAFHDSMVTEFVLYDTMHVSPYPWAPGDLHPSLESAAIVIQVPYRKRESLKYSSGDRFSHQVQDKLDFSPAQQTARVNVVTPMGSHSVPNSESCGPLPLLDRWRLGGGCDCGGWDMACPIVVFASTSSEPKEPHSFLQNDRPFELHVQGAKERTPALTIQVTGKGQYTVDFQAQLSVFQAFAVCVAMLHATEASSRAEQAKDAQCSALKALVKDEVKILIESVTEKERVRKTVEDQPSSFMLNPPFSPMSRV